MGSSGGGVTNDGVMRSRQTILLLQKGWSSTNFVNRLEYGTKELIQHDPKRGTRRFSESESFVGIVFDVEKHLEGTLPQFPLGLVDRFKVTDAVRRANGQQVRNGEVS